MKKSTLLIYIIIFFVVCILPSVLTLFGVESKNVEKRELASAPRIFKNGINLDYTKDFDDYFSDNFALRPFFITIYANLSKSIFKTSVNDNVIIGKNDFLFFAETIDSFTGQDRMSDEEIISICKIIKQEQDRFEKQGIEFFFVCAPNKNTIYPEYMPSRFKKNEDKSNMTRIYEMMDEYGINFVDLRDNLLNAKSYEQIYHKDDSHWNNYGAVVAYETMMEKTYVLINGKDYPIYSDKAYEKKDSFKGDLRSMLFPASNNMDMQIEYSIDKDYTSRRPIVNLEAIEIITNNDKQNKSAFVFRDSFFNAQIGFFSNAFNEIEYSRKVPYDFDFAFNKNVDIVILEIVERNLPILSKNLK